MCSRWSSNSLSVETERQFFFVLALPRSRTAWAALLLASQGAFCFHEGMANCATFAAFEERLRSRPEAVVGDSDSALVHHLETLLARFPGARFAFIERDEHEAMRSLIEAEPWREDQIRESWPAQVAAFRYAQEVLPAAPRVRFEDFETFDRAADFFRHLTGAALDHGRWEVLNGLRVLNRTDKRVTDAPRAVDFESSGLLTPQRLAELGFDLSGLSVRHYQLSDFPTLNAWRMHRHSAQSPLAETTLPPLGVVVEDEHGPAGALFCYESFGVGVGILELALSRPGLSVKRAGAVMAFAVCACVQLAGKLVEPQGEFRLFRSASPPVIVRFLKRLGFVQADSTPHFTMFLRNE